MSLSQWLADLMAFLDAGGPVLWMIAGVLVMMWSVIAERWLYFTFQRRSERRALLEEWIHLGRMPPTDLFLVRRALISRERIHLNRTMPSLRALIVICPLLGLLGTVTGMIQVFDAITLTGGNNARLVSEGVSRATLPTMAGMVAALSGLFAFGYLRRRGTQERTWCEQHLPVQDTPEQA